MASYLVQSGTTLYRVLSTGTKVALSLPPGVTLYGASNPCRFALFSDPLNDPILVVVNGATQDLWIDKYGTVRILTIPSPTAAPTVAQGSGTGLTGTFACATTYKVKSPSGATLWESGVGPISPLSSALANKSIKVTNIPIQSSQYGINARGVYRTLNGGNTLYPWIDIDDNSNTQRDYAGIEATDAMLSLLPAPALRFGTPPLMKLVVAWKDLLWGIARNKPDFVRWCEPKLFYAWPQDNELTLATAQSGSGGVTAFIPRRDQLGIARLEQFYEVTGDSNDTFARERVTGEIGCLSQESVVIVNNEAFFLGPQGLVQWGANGIGYISDAQVYPWFNSDTYFNRALFSQSQAGFNPTTGCVELMLAAAGSNVLDRWIAFDVDARRFFGPHKTDAFTPSCIGTDGGLRGFIHGTTALSKVTARGSADSFVYIRDETQVDDVSTSAVAITAIIDLPYLFGDDPALTTLFLPPDLTARKETTGGSLTIIPSIGDDDQNLVAGAPVSHDLSQGHSTLPIRGVGRYEQLSIQHAQAGETFRLEELEVPYNTVGRRSPGGI